MRRGLTPHRQSLSFNPRTREGCDRDPKTRPQVDGVSIRAPAKGAMPTHSKIRLFRVFSTPHRAQNRRYFGNPFPHSHPCVRPLREKTCQFHDHLRFALELPFGSSHHHLCCGCKFSAVHAKRPSFGLSRHPTKRRNRPC